MKWTHENFQIYAVPGVTNTFNAMISIVETVHQTTSLSTFYTLQAHAERILQKEQALDRRANGQQVARRSSTAQSPSNNATPTSDVIEASVGTSASANGNTTGGTNGDDVTTTEPAPNNSALKKSASAAKASSGLGTRSEDAKTT